MSSEWFSDTLFWSDFAPLMFNRDRVERTAYETSALKKLCSLTNNSKGLDTFCGQGRYTRAFNKEGMIMTGVDITREYIEKAESDARDIRSGCNFICSDMRDFKEPETYDFALNLYTSLGYMDNPDDEQAILKNIYSSLKPGGKLIIETLGKECYAMNPQKNEWFTEEDYTILVETSPIYNWTRLENHWIFYKGSEKKEFTFSHGLYSALELGLMLEQAGFSEVEFYGDFDGRPYDENAKTLLAVAVRS